MKVGFKSKVALIVAGIFLVCGAVWAQTEVAPGTNGTAQCTVKGFGPRDVSVDITVENGTITNVTVTGEFDAPGLAANTLGSMAEEIKSLNSSEIAIDGYAGATTTATAVRDAARQAIQQIVSGS